MLGPKVIYVRCINCSYNNVAKGICLLDFLLIQEKIMQVRAFERYIPFYQSSLILTELFQHNLINVSYLMACYLYQVMMTLHFFNDVPNDAESTQK